MSSRRYAGDLVRPGRRRDSLAEEGEPTRAAVWRVLYLDCAGGAAGDMVLFPSYLYHRTLPFESDAERICVAFDVIPETG